MSWAATILVWVLIFGAGWLIGWIMGEDHGREETNKRWIENEDPPRKWVKPEGGR